MSRSWPKYGDNDRKYREVRDKERTAEPEEPALHIPQQPQERQCSVDHQDMSIDTGGRGVCPECGVPLH